ncbi:MAG: putative aldehyde dehydrogenase AldA, partial [Verrucomicrobiota bacterium]
MAPPASSRRSRRPAPELLFGDLWPYDPAPETADPRIRAEYDLFIGGRFVPAADGTRFTSINPATERPLTELARGGPADVDAACRAAAAAFPRWARLPGAERGKYLFRLARLLQDRAREFAVAETMDNGKPIRETRDFDVPSAAAHF